MRDLAAAQRDRLGRWPRGKPRTWSLNLAGDRALRREGYQVVWTPSGLEIYHNGGLMAVPPGEYMETDHLKLSKDFVTAKYSDCTAPHLTRDTCHECRSDDRIR